LSIFSVFNRLFCFRVLYRLYIVMLNYLTMYQKTYILLLLALSFSYVNAQQNSDELKKDKLEKIKIEYKVNVVTDSIDGLINEPKSFLISEEALKALIISSRVSDIKTLSNRERNVENIKILFPKMNKVKKA